MTEPIVERKENTKRARTHAFRALDHRNYRLFFYGQVISVIGTWMQSTALPLLIVKIAPKKPGLWLGFNGFLPLLPLVFLTLITGSLADRYPKRTIVVVAQTMQMLQAFSLAALSWFGTPSMWQILALTLVSGIALAIDLPARKSLVFEMIDNPDDLSSAIALDSATINLGRAIGPVIAGLLIAALDFSAAFIVNGLSFLAVITGLLLMRLPPRPALEKQSKLGIHLKEGFQYVRADTTLLVVMSLVGVSAFLSVPFMTLMPIFAEKTLASSAQPVVDAACGVVVCRNPAAVTYGLLTGMFGIGALIGALLVGTHSDGRRGKLLTIGNCCFPAALVIFALSRSLGLSLIVLLGAGIAFIMQNALANTLVQMSTPNHFRGRVMSMYSLVFQGMAKAGAMQAGFMETVVGAPLAVASAALVSLGYCVLVLLKWPQIRKMP